MIRIDRAISQADSRSKPTIEDGSTVPPRASSPLRRDFRYRQLRRIVFLLFLSSFGRRSSEQRRPLESLPGLRGGSQQCQVSGESSSRSVIRIVPAGIVEFGISPMSRLQIVMRRWRQSDGVAVRMRQRNFPRSLRLTW
jgi:hypothetical protein